jgi:ABC-type sugar transport system ATPase subunit
MVEAVEAAVGDPVLAAHGVTKRYGGVHALERVDFELHAGECLGLLGDNGAGKSTLMKILSGALKPDEGTVSIKGEPVEFHSPTDARRAGIETVYQDLALARTLDAPTNIFLGREEMKPGLLGKLGFVNRKLMRTRAKQLLSDFKVNLHSLELPVNSLSGGQQQTVAIVRALAWGQPVLLLDEPMAALGIQQSQVVVELIKSLREHAAISIVLVSHDLPRVFEVADRIVVLRQGRRVASLIVRDCGMEEAVSAITGAAA